MVDTEQRVSDNTWYEIEAKTLYVEFIQSSICVFHTNEALLSENKFVNKIDKFRKLKNKLGLYKHLTNIFSV